MLAWIHQATASEHEFLSSLFGLEERRRMIGSKRSEEREEDETLVAEILDKNLEGLGRPLKVSHTEVFEIALLMVDAYPADNQEPGRHHYDLQDHQSGAILPSHYEKDDWLRCSPNGNAPTVSRFFPLLVPH
jgi:hypothetical protein